MLLKQRGGVDAVKLLEHWTGKTNTKGSQPVMEVLIAWQKWYAVNYPKEPKAELPQDRLGARWTYGELMDLLMNPASGAGDADRGKELFLTKGLCAKCHRYGNMGEGIGPDLTTVSRRFHRKEILESVLYPSQVISDRFASKNVITTKGHSHTGIVSQQADGSLVLLDAQGRKIYLAADEVEEIVPSRLSAMPEGLLNSLSRQEILDLFEFMAHPSGESKPAVTENPAPVSPPGPALASPPSDKTKS